ncbi:MAG: helix-turn-helix domain-containing protein, partial [Planctomycetaceae bacterium]|nr:helix-turn-helix domain-containing protein [Planctomycetaceae bacterium]
MDRIRVVIALALGYQVSDLALIFMLDGDTIRHYFRLYKEGGINGLLEIHYKGHPSYLPDEQKEELKEHLRQNIY